MSVCLSACSSSMTAERIFTKCLCWGIFTKCLCWGIFTKCLCLGIFTKYLFWGILSKFEFTVFLGYEAVLIGSVLLAFRLSPLPFP
jgi:hypothetical protein